MLAASCAVQFIVENYVVFLVRLWFNYPVYYIKRAWNLFPHTALDGYEVKDGVEPLERGVRYGPGVRETFNVLRPATNSVSGRLIGAGGVAFAPPPLKGLVFNVHGGGFVCTQDEVRSGARGRRARH